MNRVIALSALLACTSCREAPDTGSAAAAPASTPASVDPRGQEELARAIDAAEGPDTEDIGAAYQRVRSSWLGHRYRWRVAVVPALCSRADRCNVLAFESSARSRGIVHGWMPRLELGADAFASIQKRCRGRDLCRADIEGTLADLVLSTEQPTAVRFRDVRIAALVP